MNSGMKTALIMEGGAMRGMFTCGVMDALMENGITFDGAAGISAGAVFNLILQIGAGTGLIYLLRWFWMRINAWSEITAMAVSFVVAVFLQLVYPHLDLPPLLAWHRLLIVMAITTAAWVGVTLATPPTEAAKRAAFQCRIHASGHDIAWGLLATTVASFAIYALMFAAGLWIYGRTLAASALTAFAVAAGIAIIPVLKRLNNKSTNNNQTPGLCHTKKN